MSELKKCPFCEKEYNTGHSEKCYFRIRGKSDEEREIAWQSRPIEVALLSRAEKAEAELDLVNACGFTIEYDSTGRQCLHGHGVVHYPEVKE